MVKICFEFMNKVKVKVNFRQDGPISTGMAGIKRGPANITKHIKSVYCILSINDNYSINIVS